MPARPWPSWSTIQVSSATPSAVSRRRNMRDCCGKSASEDVLICQYAPRAVMRLRWLLPAIEATTLGWRSRIARASGGQRVVGEDDDGLGSCRAAAPAARAAAGLMRASRRAVAVDRVDEHGADPVGEVDGVVEARACSSARSPLAGVDEAAVRVGRDVDAREARTGCRAARRSRCCASISLARDPVEQLGVQRRDQLVAVGDGVDRGVGGTSPWASTSWLPTSGYNGASSPSAVNGRWACGERAGVRGRVEVGAVVEGVGRVGLLDAAVAGAPLSGLTRPPLRTARARSSSLRWALSVMSPVTNTASGLLAVERADGGVERLCARTPPAGGTWT